MSNKKENKDISENSKIENMMYNLNKISNYNKFLKDNINDILFKFIYLLKEYFIFFNEKINIKNKQDKIKYFIFEKGIFNLFNNFKILLYYTKNLELTEYYCKKSTYFYVEYVEQIFSEQNLFLNLTSKDAMIFSCKKTIFDISNDIKAKISHTNDETIKYEKIIKCLDIFKKSINQFFNNKSLYENTEDDTICILTNDSIDNIIENLENFIK